jgi:hypothetical protein
MVRIFKDVSVWLEQFIFGFKVLKQFLDKLIFFLDQEDLILLEAFQTVEFLVVIALELENNLSQ